MEKRRLKPLDVRRKPPLDEDEDNALPPEVGTRRARREAMRHWRECSQCDDAHPSPSYHRPFDFDLE
jgi:hypothetical protein